MELYGVEVYTRDIRLSREEKENGAVNCAKRYSRFQMVKKSIVYAVFLERLTAL
jgi:hypothetical protein